MDETAAFLIGGICVTISTGQSLYLLIQHLRYFNKPEYQLYICRIILMVPIYCLTSCISMMFPSIAVEFTMIKDCYEAFVIYSFTILLINYVGGDRRLSLNLELKENITHPWPLSYCFQSFHPGTYFLRLVKIGVLQFVIFRPLVSILSTVLEIIGLYHDSYFGPDDSYLYLFILNNVSFCLALYGLVLFYLSTEELLEPYRPLPKFLCIKGVIFFSFWQGIALNMMQNAGVINKTTTMSSHDVAILTQNVLVCVEMLVASFVHSIAFGYEEYVEKIEQVYSPINHNMADNIKSILLAQDVIKEVKDSISGKSFEYKQDN